MDLLDLTLHVDSIFCLLDLKKWLKIGEKQTNEKTVNNVFFLDLKVLFLPFYKRRNNFWHNHTTWSKAIEK
jgi:hypothetical protein